MTIKHESKLAVALTVLFAGWSSLAFCVIRWERDTFTINSVIATIVILCPLIFFMARRFRMATRILLGVWAVLLCGVTGFIVLEGLDIDPIDDADLVIQEKERPGSEEDNGWTILSNTDLEVPDWLDWYVAPTVSGVPSDRSINLSFFTDDTFAYSYLEKLLKWNECVLARIDAALAAKRFEPPSVRLYASERYSHEVRLSGIDLCVLLLARMKCAFVKKDDHTACECLRKSLRLAELMQTRCGCLDEYQDGTTMIEMIVDCLEQCLSETIIAPESLPIIHEGLRTLPGFAPSVLSHAFRREYTIAKHRLSLHRDFDLRSKSHVLVWTLGHSYHFQLNRTVREMAEQTRRRIAEIEPSGLDVRDERPRRTGHVLYRMNNDRGYSCASSLDLDLVWTGRDVKRVKKEVISLRDRISGIIESRSQIMPQHITMANRYFPLVATNGLYYTSGLKRVIGLDKRTKTITVGGQVEIDGEVDCRFIHEIVIPPECVHVVDETDVSLWEKKGCDHSCEFKNWIDVLTEPKDLKSVTVSPDHPEIGVEGDCVYHKGTGTILNFLCADQCITIPVEGKRITSWNLVKLIDLCKNGSICELHFRETLPECLRRMELWWYCFYNLAKELWRHPSWWDFSWRVFRYACDFGKTTWEVLTDKCIMISPSISTARSVTEQPRLEHGSHQK